MPIMSTGNVTRDRLLAKRAQFRAQYAEQDKPKQAEPASAVEAQPVSQAAPQVEPVTVAPADVAQTTPVFSFDATHVADVQPQAQPAQPVHTSDELEASRAREAELNKELESLRKERESNQKALAEYKKFQDEKAVDDYLKGLGELDTMSADDARKLVRPLLDQIRTNEQATQKRIAEERAEFDKRFASLDTQSAEAKQKKAYAALFKAHPDAAQLQYTDAFKRAMVAPVSQGSTITVGALMQAELNRGNADYAIQVLNGLKQAQPAAPDLSNVASVGSTAPTGAAPSADHSGDLLSPEQIRHYRYLAQTKQISREEFHDIMAKHKEASKQLR